MQSYFLEFFPKLRLFISNFKMSIDVKKFIIRGLIFATPIALFFGISFYVLFTSSELESWDSIVQKWMSDDPVQVGMVYSTLPRYLKLASVLARKPDIIVMGSSRSNQVRAGFFKKPDKFYNAQIGGSTIEDYGIFLNKIPTDSQPKVILLGLHPEFFDNSCRSADTKTIEEEYSQKFGQSGSFKAWEYGYKQLYLDYFGGKFKLKDLSKLGNDSGKIGLNAILHNAGYRNDGSYFDGRVMADLLSHPRNDSYKDTFKNQFFSNEIKQTCPDNHAYAINQVSEFLKNSSSRNIYVIGFMPPLASIINKTIGVDKKYGYIKNLDSDLKPLFEKYKFGFYNFVDFSKLDPEDKEMIDPTHGSEKTMLRVIISMLRDNQTLKRYTDINYLNNLLKSSKNNFFVFEN
ncbi:hypothetical protein A3J19_05025 [Candidatus Daviesbacteria bacterium RIFCSPLOWO2_02_FULL_41_8]|uniref:Uncharacterized protein n=1 Tax=Candidatus Daviesbacteria bacterium RIFCSPLOWO2_02_FULL_41_8 TaxID=1797798 RepID=A0A1F5NMU7_9BACT|nr:MAG: hypothetical protein A3J19_05025 [Candidatus Daviesbacteria bacterium RIFCSPLOWO2_02_FULL_41_8]